MIGYIITGIVSFCVGFFVASLLKDNVNIGFGNKSITQVYYNDKEQKNK
jgi:hypothetical protein